MYSILEYLIGFVWFSVLNYEERAVYVLKLRAFDGIHENERELVVKVEDVNDNAPVFDKEIYSAQIDSGIPINSPFIKVLVVLPPHYT